MFAQLGNEQRLVFCTLFNIYNEHLTKDVGLIPYCMCKYENYDSIMATYINGDYPNLKYVPGLRLEEVPKISCDWLEDSCKWLQKNAKKIDILNLYHMGERSLKHARTYKKFNPCGKIYLKMDAWQGLHGFGRLRPKLWMHPRLFFKSRMQLKLYDCMSTELAENAAPLSKVWKHKIISVANPVNPNEIRDFKPFIERSNVIFYVGRVERAKGSHTVLEAFVRINQQIPSWKLKLTGSITDKDKDIYGEFMMKYPDLKERVIFTGEIRDREQLINLYRDAKIFAFPSRYEGCPLALTEALQHGLFAVTSDILPHRSMTENFRFAFGSKVDDIDGLAKNLLYACTHEDESEKLALEGRNIILERCNLKRICYDIINNLK